MIELECQCTCQELCRDIEQLVEQYSGTGNSTDSAQNCSKCVIYITVVVIAFTSESKHKTSMLLLIRSSIIVLASSVHCT